MNTAEPQPDPCCGYDVRADYEVINEDTLRCPRCGKRYIRDGIAAEPQPDVLVETNSAYNGAEMIQLQNELLGPVERERLQRAPAWTRSVVNGLIQRIYNRRRMVAQRDKSMSELTSTRNEYGGRIRSNED